ncbi:hypothetical protein [uncultured Ruegeria sp.]|uniref:hypothetical protein n=1 Tax=uncultured Ruegeria sp. TaxID=259304 RepID=UPI0026357C58|nr:hypothetical protein [uncultured Ruegeria sp.]
MSVVPSGCGSDMIVFLGLGLVGYMVGHLCGTWLLDSTFGRSRLGAHDGHDALWLRMSWDGHVSCHRSWC